MNTYEVFRDFSSNLYRNSAPFFVATTRNGPLSCLSMDRIIDGTSTTNASTSGWTK